MPGAVNWQELDRKKAAHDLTGRAGNYNVNRDRMPYECYYDDEARKIVEVRWKLPAAFYSSAWLSSGSRC